MSKNDVTVYDPSMLDIWQEKLEQSWAESIDNLIEDMNNATDPRVKNMARQIYFKLSLELSVQQQGSTPPPPADAHIVSRLDNLHIEQIYFAPADGTNNLREVLLNK